MDGKPMMCPVCGNVELKMTDRQGVELDYCPKCRGVWLDRGELDKIIELSVPRSGTGGGDRVVFTKALCTVPRSVDSLNTR